MHLNVIVLYKNTYGLTTSSQNYLGTYHEEKTALFTACPRAMLVFHVGFNLTACQSLNYP